MITYAHRFIHLLTIVMLLIMRVQYPGTHYIPSVSKYSNNNNCINGNIHFLNTLLNKIHKLHHNYNFQCQFLLIYKNDNNSLQYSFILPQIIELQKKKIISEKS